MFSAILFRDFSVNSVCATGFQVCAFVCWTKADSNTRTYGRKQRIHAEHEQKALNLLYAAIATILISRANTHTLYLVFFSLVLVINRILAVSIAPLRLHFSYCAPLISIRQMDVMPIILMWTCWKLERNVQISAPFYWKYHRLFTSKSKFHSSLVCEQENTTFISTVNFLGYMDCRNWALFLSLSRALCVETHTESGKIFALFAPSKISTMCMHHHTNDDDDCVVAVSMSAFIRMQCTAAQSHCRCLYVLAVHFLLYDVAIVSGALYDVLLIKTICRFSEQLPMDALLLIINRWNYWQN